jgi:catechol 2,3-dioxygenase-like lactoylglutathione lyase family enzyme
MTQTLPATPTGTASSSAGAADAVTGFNHLAVLTADIERLVAFYRDVLGGEPVDVPAPPGTRARAVRFGPTAALVMMEIDDNPHTDGRGEELHRGHLDHVGFEAPTAAALEAIRQRLVASGASDGHVNDYGALVTVNFTDPDGMATEVCWLRDPALRNLHPPLPLDGHLADQNQPPPTDLTT